MARRFDYMTESYPFVGWVRDILNPRGAALLTLISGVLTTSLTIVELEPFFSLFSLIHLNLIVGLPLAVATRHMIRSWGVVLVVAIALSIALTALAAQMFIWFEIASRTILVVMVTLYSLFIAWMLDAGEAVEPPPARLYERGSGRTSHGR